jgi:phosphoglycolate phosphatase
MNIKGLIFDLDGTLLNTLEDLAVSYNDALFKNGYPIHRFESYKTFVGDGAYTCVYKALPDNERSDEIIQKVLNDFQIHYKLNFQNKTHPYAGITELLRQLSQLSIRLAVNSNKPHEFAQKCIDSYFPGMFDIVIGVSDEFPKKPDAKSTLYILNSLNLTNSDVLFVGDTRTDIQTAIAANIKSVGVSWGFRSVEELQEHGADYIVHSPLEIVNLLV